MATEIIEAHQDMVDREALLTRAEELNRALENIRRAIGGPRRHLAGIAIPSQNVLARSTELEKRAEIITPQPERASNLKVDKPKAARRTAPIKFKPIGTLSHAKRVIQPISKNEVAFNLDYEALKSEDRNVQPGEVVTPKQVSEAVQYEPKVVMPEDRSRAIEATYVFPPDSRAAVKAARRGKAVLTHGFIEKRSANESPEFGESNHANATDKEPDELAVSIKDQIARVQGLAKSGDEVRMQLSTESTRVQPGVPIAHGARA